MNSGQNAGISPYDSKSLDFLFFSYRQQIVDVVDLSAYSQIEKIKRQALQNVPIKRR
jgi:hypothetical protein